MIKGESHLIPLDHDASKGEPSEKYYYVNPLAFFIRYTYHGLQLLFY